MPHEEGGRLRALGHRGSRGYVAPTPRLEPGQHEEPGSLAQAESAFRGGFGGTELPPV